MGCPGKYACLHPVWTVSPTGRNGLAAHRPDVFSGGTGENAARTPLLGGMTLAFIAPSAMEHLFAVRWHIPEAAGHHAHGFASRKENLPA